MQKNNKETIKIILSFIGFITLFFNTSLSQELTVLYGTPMTINGGTPFSVSGLVITPSSDFTLNNISITKNEKVTNYLGQSTLARVYEFSNTAYSDISTKVTYNSTNNGVYTIVAGDCFQFDYSYLR